MQANMRERFAQRGLIGVLTGCGAIALFLIGGIGDRTLAQITPDSTLGAERSRLVQDAAGIEIEGGAIRGSSVFHSFDAFNVERGQQVYFANPAGIEAILSRVTGRHHSEIDGTLGVRGTAHLFLINPHGIVFGPHARLDVAGSLTASTATSIPLEPGWQFSAVEPDAPPLLAVNLRPGLQYGADGAAGDISSRGVLSVGQHLTLVADRLTLRNQLQAGGDLTLGAAVLRVRDSERQPFVASAGDRLLLQGQRQIDIVALGHPQSGLVAGGNLVLRSPGPIGGDAHYTAGGDLRIEHTDGSLGNWFSPNDPVIRAQGDVSFNRYSGASLHIFAGGSVNIGSVEITGPDASHSIRERVRLSNGSSLSIDGGTQPTLDIRAGTIAVSPAGIDGTPVPDGFGQSVAPSSAAIRIGRISITQPHGLVFLTNQYQPNAALSGAIALGDILVQSAGGGGSVVIDARNDLVLTGLMDVSGSASELDPITADSGNVTLLARGDMALRSGSLIYAGGLLGGQITLVSQGAMSIDGIGDTTAYSVISETFSDDRNATGGGITLSGQTFRASNFGSLVARTFGAADAGGITLKVQDSVSLNFSEIVTATEEGTGDGGNVSVTARSLSLTDNSGLLAVTLGDGNAGNVFIQGSESATLNDSQIASIVFPDASGQGGNLEIQTDSLLIENGAQVNANTFGRGDAGQVLINVDVLRLDGISGLGNVSGIFSSSNAQDGEGDGGNIEIEARSLAVTNGAQISASTEGLGDAGLIQIVATEFMLLDGSGFDPSQNGVLPSSVLSEVLSGSGGDGGDISVTTPRLTISNSAQISASTDSVGDAGTIQLDAAAILFTGSNSGIFANTFDNASGAGGDIRINSDAVRIQNGAQIFVGSDGTGVGGSINLAANTLLLDQGVISAETASTDGGNISLSVEDVMVLRRHSQISTTAGNERSGGNGGNITIDTDYLVTVASDNSDITANAFEGNGGNIGITALGVLGIEPRRELTSLSDITATSEFGIDGVIAINRPDVDPSRGVAALPEDVVDASHLVAQGCSVGNSTVASSIGEFIVTGRGGLPPNPTERLSGELVLGGWERLSPSVQPSGDPTDAVSASLPLSDALSSDRIIEAQGWAIAFSGDIVLVQSSNVIHSPVWRRAMACPAS